MPCSSTSTWLHPYGIETAPHLMRGIVRSGLARSCAPYTAVCGPSAFPSSPIGGDGRCAAALMRETLPVCRDGTLSAYLEALLAGCSQQAKQRVLASNREAYSDSVGSLLVGAAMPKKIRTARFSRTIFSSARRPTRARILAFANRLRTPTTPIPQPPSLFAPWLATNDSRRRVKESETRLHLHCRYLIPNVQLSPELVP